MDILEFIENENIKSDRFGMAAISYIFKAFGDNIRSQEFWPWGKSVQCPWTASKGLKNDLNMAVKLLSHAISADGESPEVNKLIGVKTLKERLKINTNKINSADIINDRINETSNDINNRMEDLEKYE